PTRRSSDLAQAVLQEGLQVLVAVQKVREVLEQHVEVSIDLRDAVLLLPRARLAPARDAPARRAQQIHGIDAEAPVLRGFLQRRGHRQVLERLDDLPRALVLEARGEGAVRQKVLLRRIEVYDEEDADRKSTRLNS